MDINRISKKLKGVRFKQPAFSINVGQSSHKGMVRSTNEDSIVCTDLSGLENLSGGIYAVADGVGGYEAGEIASKLALDTLVADIMNSFQSIDTKDTKVLNDTELISQIITEAVQAANTEVYVQAQSRNNRMGTTLAAALVINNHVYIANVGDSRVYKLENEQLRKVTTDHSLVAELVASGAISADDIYTHPQRNMITRFLGTQNDVEVDIFMEDFNPGTSLVVCSDGLWEMVRDDRIKEIIIQSSSAQAACDSLVEEANKNGGVDNIAVVIVKAQ